MPSYYNLWEDPDCQGPPAADGLYQVAGGVWPYGHEHLYDPGPPSLPWPVQSSLPHGHSQGPAGHQAQLHPRLVAQSHVVGGHWVHQEQAGGQSGQAGSTSSEKLVVCPGSDQFYADVNYTQRSNEFEKFQA